MRLVILVLTGYIAVWGCSIPSQQGARHATPSIKFDARRWSAQTRFDIIDSPRWEMVDDLLANHTAYGLSRDDIVQTLGPPTVSVAKDELRTARAYAGSNDATVVSTIGYPLTEDPTTQADAMTIVLVLS